jgi:hypothetical protein
MKYKLNWIGERPDFAMDRIIFLDEEIAKIEQSIDDPSQLIYDIVFLTDNMEGESVVVYGIEGDSENLFLEYNETTIFVDVESDV